MNGIIHQCSHPNDEDVHFRITEEKIIADIFHYIEVLFRIIKPRKVFFMAVDGVAPRAKMNQQRGRRFRCFIINGDIADKLAVLQSQLTLHSNMSQLCDIHNWVSIFIFPKRYLQFAYLPCMA